MRKLAPVILALVFMSQNVYAHGDLPSEWAEHAIQRVASAEVIDMNRFHFYHKTITREEYAYLIYQLYEYLAGDPIAEVMDLSLGNNFDDLTMGHQPDGDDHGHSFADTDNLYIQSLKSAGLINGYPDGSFKPDAPISREEIMVLYSRLLEDLGYEMSLTEAVFQDQASISLWAEDGVRKCYASGLIKGVGEQKIDPLGMATVEESLVVLARILEHDVYKPTSQVALQTGPIVSDGRRTYGVAYDVFGKAIGIEAFEDFTLMGTVYKGSLQSDQLILEKGLLYFTDGDGLFRKYDTQVVYTEYYPALGDYEPGLKTKVFSLNEDGHLMCLDKGSGSVIDYGAVDAIGIEVSWNYLILEEEAINGAPYKRFIPICRLKDYLY